MIHEVAIPLDKGWEDGCTWLFEQLGEKFTDAGRSTRGPDTPGYLTTHSDIESSPFGWDVCYDPGPGMFRFMIKDRDVALIFKLTFGGA